MKRVLALLSLGLALVFLSGGPSWSADDKKPDPKAEEKKADDKKPEEKKADEKKGPALKLDVADRDVVVGKPTALKFKVTRTEFDGPVKVKMTIPPADEKSKDAPITQEKTLAKGEDSGEFELRFDKGTAYEATLEAAAGELKDEAKIAITIRRNDPSGEITGDKGTVSSNFPDLSKQKFKAIDSQKPDLKDVSENFDKMESNMIKVNQFLGEVADVAGKNRLALNMMWTLLTGFLVMFMQLGFALVETGLTRGKNVAHTMAMNLMIYGIGMMAFWAFGFAIMYGGAGAYGTMSGPELLTSEYSIKLFGKDFGLFGYDGFFLTNRAFDVGILTLFLFQMVFMDTAATIPTGALAERWKFLAFCVYGVFIAGLIYPVYGNWVWGSTGWLNQLGANFQLGHGHVDFAGSSVVHMTGGITALAGVLVLGPRLGKYNRDGSVNALPAHSVPMYVTGTLILAFGWFGFNPGSTQAGSDLNIGRIAANTMLASAAGMCTAAAYMWIVYKKPDPSFMCNGMLAGLVAITAPCAFVSPCSAVLIGAIAGILVIWACLFFERIAKIDDPVGAIGVHGINGIWGILAVGIFADGTYGKGLNGVFLYKDKVTGTFHWLSAALDPKNAPDSLKGVNLDNLEAMGVTGLIGGNTSQFYAELIGIGANIVWVFVSAYIVFWIIELIIGNRVSKEVEMQGLDIPEMGVAGYINEDPKVPEGHLLHASAEPKAATTPTNGEKRFTVVVQGADFEQLTETWSGLCQPGTAAPSKEFLLIYPHMTTLQGNRFRFRGGDPELIRSSVERLLQAQMRGKPVRTTIEN